MPPRKKLANMSPMRDEEISNMSDEEISNISYFTPRAQQVLALARKEADWFNHNFVGTEHLLLGLIKLGQGVAVNVLQKMGLDLETVRLEVEKQVGTSPDQKQVGNIPYTPRVKKVLNLASKEAKALAHTYVGTEHILLGILREGDLSRGIASHGGPGVAARVLKNLDVDIEQTRQEILRELDPNFVGGDDELEEYESEVDLEELAQQLKAAVASGKITQKEAFEKLADAGEEEANEPESHLKTPAIKAFGRNLTKEFHYNDWDPVFVRADIIQRVIQVLCRHMKNSPVLVGEAGIGKTGIIRGLVQAIAKGRVPEDLINCQIISLDSILMFAGAQHQGQLEERILAVEDEARRAKNIILFIEELHMLYNPKQSDEKPNLWQIIQTVLTVDSEHYSILFPFLQSEKISFNQEGKPQVKDRPYNQTSSDLSSVYHLTQFIEVEEPDDKVTLDILKALRPNFEKHHNVKINDDALEFAVALSEEHIKERCFPSKAIDVIDEACSRKRCQVAMTPTQEEMDLEQKISDTKARLEQLIKEKEWDFEGAATIQIEVKQLTKRLENIRGNCLKYARDFTLELKDVDMLFPATGGNG